MLGCVDLGSLVGVLVRFLLVRLFLFAVGSTGVYGRQDSLALRGVVRSFFGCNGFRLDGLPSFGC